MYSATRILITKLEEKRQRRRPRFRWRDRVDDDAKKKGGPIDKEIKIDRE